MEPAQGIEQLRQQFRGAYLRLPIILGNEAVNFTLDNFRLQGFMGASFQRWLPVKQNSWGKKKRGNSILISSGRLRRSIRIVQLNADMVSIGSDVKYARAHNEGLRMGFIQQVKGHERKITGIGTVHSIATKRTRKVKVQVGSQNVKAHTRRVDMRIPPRPFMGNSPYLNARLKRAGTALFLREIRGLKT